MKSSRQLRGQVMNEGDDMWSALKRMEGRCRGLSSTLNINLAAIGALLDNAVLHGAICRDREQLR